MGFKDKVYVFQGGNVFNFTLRNNPNADLRLVRDEFPEAPTSIKAATFSINIDKEEVVWLFSGTHEYRYHRDPKKDGKQFTLGVKESILSTWPQMPEEFLETGGIDA